VKLHVVLDMVGGAFDERWIDTETALELMQEHGHVSRERALAMLCSDDATASEWTPRGDDGRWTP
jgi:hypothetical protein